MGEIIEFPTGKRLSGSPAPDANPAEPSTEPQVILATLVSQVTGACLDALTAAAGKGPDPRHPSQGPRPPVVG